MLELKKKHNKWEEKKESRRRGEKRNKTCFIKNIPHVDACEALKSLSPGSCEPRLLQSAFLSPKEVITGIYIDL